MWNNFFVLRNIEKTNESWYYLKFDTCRIEKGIKILTNPYIYNYKFTVQYYNYIYLTNIIKNRKMVLI